MLGDSQRKGRISGREASFAILGHRIGSDYIMTTHLATSTDIWVWLLVAGGIVYSVGALSYGFKFPKLSPRVFGYHELFHVFVSIAAIIHFIAIYSIILH